MYVPAPRLSGTEFSCRNSQQALFQVPKFIGTSMLPCDPYIYFGTPRKIHRFTPNLIVITIDGHPAPNLCIKQVSHPNVNSPHSLFTLNWYHSEKGAHYVPRSRIVERSSSSLPVRLFLITSVPYLSFLYSTPKIHHGGSSAPHAAQVPDGLYASSGTSTAGVSIAPQATYNGGYTDAKDVRLRIANGGAGQSGLIGAWADAFIKYMVQVRHFKPFLVSIRFSARGDITNTLLYQVAWYLGDTTESLGLLEAGSVDIAVTYNEAAEKQSKDSGAAVALVYGFRVSLKQIYELLSITYHNPYQTRTTSFSWGRNPIQPNSTTRTIF